MRECSLIAARWSPRFGRATRTWLRSTLGHEPLTLSLSVSLSSSRAATAAVWRSTPCSENIRLHPCWACSPPHGDQAPAYQALEADGRLPPLTEPACCALAGTDGRPLPLRRRTGRPQLKRDPVRPTRSE